MSVKKELMLELKKIYDDKDFVCSTVDIAKTEAAWETLLDYIHTADSRGDKLSSDNIQLVAMKLRDEEDAKQRENVKARIASVLL